MMTETGTDISAPQAAKPTRGRRSVGLDARHNGAAFAFLTPWLIGLFCLTLGPIVVSFYLSLTDYDMFTSPEFVGAANYQKMLSGDPRYYQALKVTFTYVFLGVPLKLAFALGVALIATHSCRCSKPATSWESRSGTISAPDLPPQAPKRFPTFRNSSGQR